MTKIWFVLLINSDDTSEIEGPFTLDELATFTSITPQTLVRKGSGEWKEAKEYEELKNLLEEEAKKRRKKPNFEREKKKIEESHEDQEQILDDILVSKQPLPPDWTWIIWLIVLLLLYLTSTPFLSIFKQH